MTFKSIIFLLKSIFSFYVLFLYDSYKIVMQDALSELIMEMVMDWGRIQVLYAHDLFNLKKPSEVFIS